MLHANIIHPSKFGVFLGASLAIHLVVLGHWPALTGRQIATTSRTIEIVLTPGTDSNSGMPPTGQDLAANDYDSMNLSQNLVAASTTGATDSITPLVVTDPPPLVPKSAHHSTHTQQPEPAPPQAPRRVAKVHITEKPRQQTAVSIKQLTRQPPTQVTTAIVHAQPLVSDQAPALAALVQRPQAPIRVAEVPVVRDLARLSALLHEEILRYRRYPVLAKRQRREGVATIRFELFPDGDLQAVALVNSSGYKALDRAAIQAVQRVSPFSPAGDYLSQAREFSVNVVFKLR